MTAGDNRYTLTAKEYAEMLSNLKANQSKQNINKTEKDNKSTPKNITPDWENPEYVKAMIVKIGRDQGLDDNEIQFALAIAAKESGFNVNAVGDKGSSFGAFQINKPAHPDYNAGLDPIGNITYGVRFAANKYRQANRNARLAARMYNGSGPMAERYADDFIKNYLPKYSNDFTNGKIASVDPTMPIPSMPIEAQERQEQARLANDYANALEMTNRRYNWEDVNKAIKTYQDAYNDVYKQVEKLYPNFTPDQIATASKQYLDQIASIQNFTQQNINALQQANTREQLVDPLINAYNQQSIELQNQLAQANPYTQLAKNAPIRDLQPIDMEELRASQASDRFGASMAAMQNPNAPRPDYSALRLQQAQQLEQAARYNQAVENARVTGLPVDYFLSGRGMDYNAIANLGGNRLANMQALNQDYVQRIQPNVNTNIAGMVNQANVSGVNMAEKARLEEQALINANLERAKQLQALAQSGLGQQAQFMNTGLSGANAQNIAGVQSVAPIYGSTQGAMTSRANAIENNATALEIARQRALQGDQGANINPITAANSAINAGVYSNNPQLINIGAGTTLNALGYTPEQVQGILSQGQGVNRQVAQMGMIMPNQNGGVWQ